MTLVRRRACAVKSRAAMINGWSAAAAAAAAAAAVWRYPDNPHTHTHAHTRTHTHTHTGRGSRPGEQTTLGFLQKGKTKVPRRER